MHTTIYSISESPVSAGLIWVGTDDGNLQLTRDGGEHWNNVVGNVHGLPKNSWVNWVAGQPLRARHGLRGIRPPHLRRHGALRVRHHGLRQDLDTRWSTAKDAKGVRGYAHVIKEDPVDPQLLFLGTEFGLWISIDAGAHWAQFKGGHLPAVAVRDLAVQPRDNDLVLATHGRGIWIVDDITPLRHLTPELTTQEAAFMSARPVQQRIEAQGGWPTGAAAFVGDNPQDGAVITYYQRTRQLFGKLKIQVLDAKGEVLDELPASTRRGLNRVLWTMHREAAARAAGGAAGLRRHPGTARAARHLHGAHAEGRQDLRDARSPSASTAASPGRWPTGRRSTMRR